jgi:hypothetical protein
MSPIGQRAPPTTNEALSRKSPDEIAQSELPAHRSTTQASAIRIERGTVLRTQLQDTKRSFGILLLPLDIRQTGRYALRDGRFNLEFRSEEEPNRRPGALSDLSFFPATAVP